MPRQEAQRRGEERNAAPRRRSSGGRARVSSRSQRPPRATTSRQGAPDARASTAPLGKQVTLLFLQRRSAGDRPDTVPLLLHEELASARTYPQPWGQRLGPHHVTKPSRRPQCAVLPLSPGRGEVGAERETVPEKSCPGCCARTATSSLVAPKCCCHRSPPPWRAGHSHQGRLERTVLEVPPAGSSAIP